MKAIRTLLACIRKADKTYNLINQHDKIVVGLSGGKDSIALLYCLHLYQKFSHTDFIIQPVTLDLGFPGFNPQPLVQFCESLGLKLLVSDNRDVYKILEIQKEKQNSNHLPCSICSRMKKAAINKVAKEIGFNKVAFAHHADDAIETLFMNEIYGGRIATFSPKMYLEKAEIEFIRPMILCRESDIKKLILEENLITVSSKCPADKTTTREEIKDLLNDIYHKYPKAKESYLYMLSNYEQEDIWSKEIEYKIDENGLTFKPIVTSLDAYKALNIRYRTFCIGQNISYDDEVNIKEDMEARAFLICLNKEAIGHIRYRIINNEFKLERFAVLPEFQRKGYGRKAFNCFIEFLGAKFNPCVLTLNAQYHLKEFYASCGFLEQGEPFFEANIKHIKMNKLY